MKWILFVLLICVTVSGIIFYKRQNNGFKIGGPISKPKAYWLFFVLFQYYCFSIWLLLFYGESFFRNPLIITIVLLLIRAFLQPIIMYLTKNWRPIFGMTFNILTAVTITIFTIFYFLNADFELQEVDKIQNAFLCMIVFILITDTYYAYSFNKLVKGETVGPKAIWFASSENKKFDKINRITFWLNIIFSAIFLYNLWHIFL